MMRIKLKIASFSTNFVLELEADKQTYGALRERVSSLLEEQQIHGALFDISLNGKDALVANWETPLKDLGIVSGDIVRIISDDDAFKNQGPNLDANKNSAVSDVRTPPSTSASLQPTKDSSSNSATLENASNVECATGGIPPDESEVSTESLSPLEEKLINRHLNTPMLCRESTAIEIPNTLDQAYRNAGVETKVDALVVALHVLMSETGLCQDGDPPTVSFIHTWKSHADVYNLRYSYSSCPEKLCQLTCFAMGDVLVVNGLVLNSNENNNAFTMNMAIPKYILSDPSSEKEPIAVYGNLASLSQKFKDTIAYPMLRVIQIDAGFVVSHELMSLPTEVKLYILKFLDYSSLLKVSTACRELNILANEPALWKLLFLRNFPTTCLAKSYLRTPNGTEELTWKEKYRRTHLSQKKEAKLRIEHQSYYPFLPRLGNLPVDYTLPQTPGYAIIGGDHDRYPNLPGIMPVGPLGHRGPRFNPFDPLGNIQLPGARRPPPNDPFGMGRPRFFDPFGGSGGGGLF